MFARAAAGNLPSPYPTAVLRGVQNSLKEREWLIASAAPENWGGFLFSEKSRCDFEKTPIGCFRKLAAGMSAK